MSFVRKMTYELRNLSVLLGLLVSWMSFVRADVAPAMSSDDSVEIRRGPKLSLASVDMPAFEITEPLDAAVAVVDDGDSVFRTVTYERDQSGPTRTPLGTNAAGRTRGGEALQWHIPDLKTVDPLECEWPEWILDGCSLYKNEVPHYALGSELPLFYISPCTEIRLARKIKRVVRKRMYKELRKQIKRRWKRRFRSSPSMTFPQYSEMLTKINYIGRRSQAVDEFNSDHRSRETRDAVFKRRNNEGEAEIPLLTLGPLIITDAGSLRFDFGRAAAVEEDLGELVDVGGKRSKPLFANKHYRVRSGIKLQIDPFDHRPGRNFVPFLDSYGFEVEMDRLSDVLKRNMMTTEVSVEFDNRGDVLAFFHLVIKARS